MKIATIFPNLNCRRCGYFCSVESSHDDDLWEGGNLSVSVILSDIFEVRAAFWFENKI